MSNHALLERAFELADSGTVDNIKDIQAKLIKEGHSYQYVGQIAASTLSKQLRHRIAKAKTVMGNT